METSKPVDGKEWWISPEAGRRAFKVRLTKTRKETVSLLGACRSSDVVLHRK